MPMLRPAVRVAVLTVALLRAAGVVAAEPVFQTLAPGVTVVLQPAGNELLDANSIVLSTPRGVVVVDAPADRDIVAQTLMKIERDIAQPVRFLINTHWHTDHTQGNGLYRERFGDDLLIVGHRTLTHDVTERARAMAREERERLLEIVPRAEAQLAEGLTLGGELLDDAGRQRQRAAIDEAKAKIGLDENLAFLPPDLTYDSELTLHLGVTELRLLHFAAHTEGDTVVYLPRQKILLTGDLLDWMPFAGHGYPRAWVGALEALETLDFERIVPGHGPVFEGKAQLVLLRDYFRTIVAGVDLGIRAGRTVEETVAAIDLSRFRRALAGEDEILQRNFDRFAPETIERAYALATEPGADRIPASAE